MIQMEVRICRIDEKPIEKSLAYKLIEWLFGEKFADELTYSIWLPRDG